VPKERTPVPPPRACGSVTCNQRRQGIAWSLSAFARASVSSTVTCVAIFGGCSREPTTPQGMSINSRWITESVKASVDANGRFFSVRPEIRYLTRSAAESTATAVATLLRTGQRLESHQAKLVTDHGSAIAFDRLTSCGRLTYASVATDELPVSVPGWARRAFGPQWNVPMCPRGDSRAVLTIGVPDGPRDFVVANDTVVQSSIRLFGGGADYTILAVSPAFPQGMALTPEDAVAGAFGLTAVRISSIPRAFLLLDDRDPGIAFPACASWELSFEKRVLVRGTQTTDTASVDRLFVKRDPNCISGAVQLFVPLRQQPTTRRLYFAKDTTGTLGSVNAFADSVDIDMKGLGRFERVMVIRQ
jgi:hypothetical protein